MKAAGAVSLQNGIWVLPRLKEQERLAQELLLYLEEQGAKGQLFAATALGEKVEKDLLKRFRSLRDEEYAELIERSEALVAELAKETRKKKFTFAELEENEDGLQKLEAWLERIRSRDLLGGERAAEAAASLQAARKALDTFADRVYVREGLAPKKTSSR